MISVNWSQNWCRNIMNDEKILHPELRGQILFDEDMSRHTTWRLGGPADIYFVPADMADLQAFLHQYDDIKVYFIGLGSNLLVRDAGVRGAVINMTNAIANVEEVKEGLLRIDAGVPCAIVSRKIRDLGYIGLEFMSGIPGTIGGALAMNAGAHCADTWSHVQTVTTIDRHGSISMRDKSDFDISYRTVLGLRENEWFLSADFTLQKGDLVESKNKVKDLLEYRSNTQPTKLPNAGSVFKNPDNTHAAKLIEEAGLKGFCLGGACVSDKHANFIVNMGEAKAADIENLIEMIQEKIKEKFNIQLTPEVRIIGEKQ